MIRGIKRTLGIICLLICVISCSNKTTDEGVVIQEDINETPEVLEEKSKYELTSFSKR